MTQEATTLEELQARHAEDLHAVDEAQAALQDAQIALEKGRKEPIERLLELSKAVTAAQNALTGEEKAAARTASRIQNFAFEAKKGVRETHKANLEDSIATQVDWDALIDAGVEKAAVAVDCENRTVTVKFSGPGIRTSSGTPRASGNGTRGRKVYTLNGESFDSRGMVERFGAQYLTGKVTPEMVLEFPTKHGLSHIADRLADKVGAEISQATPTTE